MGNESLQKYLQYIYGSNIRRVYDKQPREEDFCISRYVKKCFNTGSFYSLPFESSFSIFRRFLLSNPTANVSLFTENNASRKSITELLPSIYEEVRLKEAYKNNKTQPLYQPTSLSESIKKNCPICAKYGFHSDIYEISWIETCPIHKIKFLSNCPECSKPWCNLREIFKSYCGSCGRSIAVPCKEFEGYRNKHLAETKTFTKLENLIKLDIKENANKLKWVRFRTPYSASPTRTDTIFPLFAKSLSLPDSKSKSLRIGTNEVQKIIFPINSKVLYKDCRHVDNNSFRKQQKHNNWSKAIRTKVLRSLLKICDSHAIGSHKFHYRYLYYDYDYDFELEHNFCPYCIALNIWLHISENSYLKYHFWVRDRDDPLFGFPKLYPNDVNIKYLRSDREHHIHANSWVYVSTLEYQKWAYEYSLRCCFNDLINEANKFRTQKVRSMYKSCGALISIVTRIKTSRLVNTKYSSHSIMSFINPTENKIVILGQNLLNPNSFCFDNIRRFDSDSCVNYFAQFTPDYNTDSRQSRTIDQSAKQKFLNLFFDI